MYNKPFLNSVFLAMVDFIIAYLKQQNSVLHTSLQYMCQQIDAPIKFKRGTLHKDVLYLLFYDGGMYSAYAHILVVTKLICILYIIIHVYYYTCTSINCLLYIILCKKNLILCMFLLSGPKN